VETLLAIGCWPLAVDYLLAIGLLTVGYWLLAVGYWSKVKS